MARYGLASHVFVCRDEEYVVVLDLRQDRYFVLEARRTAALESWVPGWPVQVGEAPGSDDAPTAGPDVTAALLHRGWLLDLSGPARAGSKDATPPQLARPASELLDEPGEIAGARIRARTVLAFLAASIFAKYALRCWPIDRVVRRVARRGAAARAAPGTVDIERARELVDAFTRLRVFLFSHQDECLHDSLALLEFLARHDLFPRWVFGVQARPFTAHCWVQHDDLVFNDSVEHSSTYTPIMVI